MKWWKHMSDMSQDARIKRLIKRYGVEGYGLYNYIIELIVRRLETESPMPDLEESSNDIATDLGMDTVRVEEIMWFCIEQGLFEQDEVTGRVVATKVYKFLAQSETRSKEIRRMISAYKNGDNEQESEASYLSQTSVTNLKNRTEQNRTEQKRGKHTKDESKSATDYYHIDVHSLPINRNRYDRMVQDYGQDTVDDYIGRAYRYSLKKRGDTKQYKDYTAAAEDYMRRDGVRKLPRESEPIVDASQLGVRE